MGDMLRNIGLFITFVLVEFFYEKIDYICIMDTGFLKKIRCFGNEMSLICVILFFPR